jgi:flagellar hook-associated protein 2
MDVFSDMENFGSSILTSLGFGNGVNYSQLATDIAEASFGFQRQTVETRRETLETQISAAGQLRSSISGLASALGDRIRNGELAPQASIGNAAVARASVPAGLSPRGNFALEVTALASSQTLVTQAYASGTALVGAGTLNIRFGTVDGATFDPDAARDPLAITVTADDTLSTLAGKITRESRGAVSAYVAQGPGGAQLVLKGGEGAANGFVLEPAGAGAAAAPGDLSYLAWNPASDAGELRGSAGDAAFELDTVEITSPTNRVTGLPGGFTLDLTATNVGAPTTVSFTNDTSAITAVMSDFVAALNDITGQLNTAAAPLGGALGSDSGARELRRELSALSRLVVNPNAAGNEPRTLGDGAVHHRRDLGVRRV